MVRVFFFGSCIASCMLAVVVLSSATQKCTSLEYNDETSNTTIKEPMAAAANTTSEDLKTEKKKLDKEVCETKKGEGDADKPAGTPMLNETLIAKGDEGPKKIKITEKKLEVFPSNATKEVTVTETAEKLPSNRTRGKSVVERKITKPKPGGAENPEKEVSIEKQVNETINKNKTEGESAETAGGSAKTNCTDKTTGPAEAKKKEEKIKEIKHKLDELKVESDKVKKEIKEEKKKVEEEKITVKEEKSKEKEQEVKETKKPSESTKEPELISKLKSKEQLITIPKVVVGELSIQKPPKDESVKPQETKAPTEGKAATLNETLLIKKDDKIEKVKPVVKSVEVVKKVVPEKMSNGTVVEKTIPISNKEEIIVLPENKTEGDKFKIVKEENATKVG